MLEKRNTRRKNIINGLKPHKYESALSSSTSRKQGGSSFMLNYKIGSHGNYYSRIYMRRGRLP
jgi:hypothetical protein